MATSIDTKQIAERVKHLRGLAFEPPVCELCGFIEHLLSERKEMLDNAASVCGHLMSDCPLNGNCLCLEQAVAARTLSTTVGDTNG